MSKMKGLLIDIQERIMEEVKKGFDSRDEMREVFLEIADTFNVSPDVIWSTYYEGYWKR